MHELSIAVSLIETASDELGKAGGRAPRVLALHLRLGLLSGVVKEALLFSFDLAAEGTPIAGARLDIEEVPVVVFCAGCAAPRTLATIQDFRCPVCGQPTPEVLSGRELELKSMEVSVDDDPHP